MSTIAFIGLGIMGSPMAVNLARAGHTVRGWNRSPGKAGALLAAGGTAAGSIAEAVEGADVVITMVPASPQVEAVAYGPDGILENAKSGALLIDMSSITPQTSIDLAEAAAAKGIHVLDAPVSGGEAGAVEAVLSIMVGGDRADFDAALDVLNGGLAGSTVLTRKKDNFKNRDYRPGFKLDLHHKDMGIVTDAARTVGAALPVGASAAQLIASAVARGDGESDHSALLRGVELLSGYEAAVE